MHFDNEIHQLKACLIKNVWVKFGQNNSNEFECILFVLINNLTMLFLIVIKILIFIVVIFFTQNLVKDSLFERPFLIWSVYYHLLV